MSNHYVVFYTSNKQINKSFTNSKKYMIFFLTELQNNNFAIYFPSLIFGFPRNAFKQQNTICFSFPTKI